MDETRTIETNPSAFLNPTPVEKTCPEKIKEKLMSLFHQRMEDIGSALASSREDETGKTRPRGVIAMSLWEQDNTMLTTKMAKHSLSDILKQAEASGIDLDVIIIANNGGSATPELGSKMRNTLQGFVEEKLGTVVLTKTSRPDGKVKATSPWDLELKLDKIKTDSQSRNRVIIVNQPFDPLNKGKLRGIRDVANALAHEITDRGYAPDFVFQMDAETRLMYSPKSGLKGKEGMIPPLKAMWNQLCRGDKIGVGTKDRFAVMDPETGEPLLDVPVGSAQKGFELTNTPENFIALPGGAMMVKPEYYVAGMSAIAETVPSVGVEDYMFTKLLREEMRQTGKKFKEKAKTMGIIKHINRTPRDWRAAIYQMSLWRKHARAVDEIFPEDPYNTEPLPRYAWLVVTQRFKDALQKGPRHLRRLLQDLYEFPEVLKLLLSDESADIFQEHSPDWSPNSVSR